VWIHNLMVGIGFHHSKSTTIYCDNESVIQVANDHIAHNVIQVANDPIAHSKMKHVELYAHYVRDLLQ
jgi:hypothetical protein